MNRTIFALICLMLWGPAGARADHRDLALFASPVLIETGFLAFLLPRFSLKTGVGVHLQPLLEPPVAGQVTAGVLLQPAGSGGGGRLVLRGQGLDFTVHLVGPDLPPAGRFANWLLSEIGQRTIAQFAPQGTPLFTGAANTEPVVQAVILTGDAARGEGLAYAKCGRCHVIGERNRMKGIGSTPSFGLLRSLDNWMDRFSAFYTLNPHPSFSQIAGVTEPFDKTRPPPVFPLSLTQQELDDIIAYTSGIAPADLGAPLVHQ